jgi:hypothetical protein
VGSFGPCFLAQPELVTVRDVTFKMTFILKKPFDNKRDSKKYGKRNFPTKHKRFSRNNGTKGSKSKDRHSANTVKKSNLEVDNDDSDTVIQCFLCKQRGDHESSNCPNATATISLKNKKKNDFEARNEREDKKHPNLKITNSMYRCLYF